MGVPKQSNRFSILKPISKYGYIKVFYTDISSCVTNNGFELLNLAIQANGDIRNEQITIALNADDTCTLFLKDLDSVQALLERLEKFRKFSGLELNKLKTEAVWLGPWAEKIEKPFGFHWPEDLLAMGFPNSFTVPWYCHTRKFRQTIQVNKITFDFVWEGKPHKKHVNWRERKRRSKDD